MIEKKCSQCDGMKTSSEFHKDSAAQDGLKSRCKACISGASKKHYSKNREAILTKKQEYREENPERIAKSLKKFAASNRKRLNSKQRARNKFDSIKMKARASVSNAIKAGKLVKYPCQVCGIEERVEAHHCDYSKPLWIMWLCHKHHIEWHQKNFVCDNLEEVA